MDEVAPADDVPGHPGPEMIKPHLRGWLHAGTAPVAIATGITLVLLARGTAQRIAVGIFAVSASLLFVVSAVFHRGKWGPRAYAALRRLDHASIFLVIAGTYTPYAVLLLQPGTARTLLAVVWTGAVLGVIFRVLWLHAPRWLYTPIYLGLGWAAVAVLPDFVAGGRPDAFALAVVGGVLYSIGAVVYALRRPNPSPRWFGFHEVFHALTVVAFLAHAVGVALALRPLTA